ncbi:hypothetical protein P8605_31355 [Streptomyces sp. T-3]|nr:hypothetical protein [Streptomyces sp. T-3]
MPQSSRSPVLLAGLPAGAGDAYFTVPKAAAIGRLPLQVPLVLSARSVARTTEGRS